MASTTRAGGRCGANPTQAEIDQEVAHQALRQGATENHVLRRKIEAERLSWARMREHAPNI
eukprot:3375995-Alexandrium_andersonii.AAC.1